MRIATYNVNGINARLPVLLKWLKSSKPDVVCLQELKAPPEKIPEKAILEAGYNAIWHGQKRWNGVAILAKDRHIEEISRELPGDPEDLQSRYIEARIETLHICGLYLPNGNPAPGPKFDYKMEWLKRFRKRSTALLKLKEPCILAGDFNIIPSEIDVYKPESWVDDALFRPEVRAEFEKLKAQGWIDALRYLYPEEIIFTFWDYFRNAFSRNAGLRIDHFLVSPGLKKYLKEVKVDIDVRGWEKTSDHAPVWMEVDPGFQNAQ